MAAAQTLVDAAGRLAPAGEAFYAAMGEAPSEDAFYKTQPLTQRKNRDYIHVRGVAAPKLGRTYNPAARSTPLRG